MNLLKTLLVLSIFVSCNTETKDDNTVISDQSQSQVSELKIRDEITKKFRKKGMVVSEVDGLSIKESSVNIWLSPNDKISLYKLSPKEPVIVFNESSDGFIIVSPTKDTTVIGYLLKGWINYE